MLSLTLLLPFLAPMISAQAGPEAFSIFNRTGRLPDGCIDGYAAGRDEFLYTVPYTYAQVLSVIGSFAVRLSCLFDQCSAMLIRGVQNITWNGINATTLNGTVRKPALYSEEKG